MEHFTFPDFTLENIPLSHLEFDDSYQRRVNISRAKKRAENFHPSSFVPPCVSVRFINGEKHFFVYDGRQRLATIALLCKESGRDPAIPCLVRRDMTQIDESCSLIDLNHNNVHFNQCDLWTTRYITNKEPEVRILTKIFTDAGWGIGRFAADMTIIKSSSKNVFPCIRTIEKIYAKLINMGYSQDKIERIFHIALTLIQDCFKRTESKRNNYIVLYSFVRFVVNNYDAMTPQNIERCVQAFTFSPKWLVQCVIMKEEEKYGIHSEYNHSKVGAEVLCDVFNNFYHIRSTRNKSAMKKTLPAA